MLAGANRALLAAGQPETRTYTAIYVVDDDEVGLVSDAAANHVPAVATNEAGRCASKARASLPAQPGLK